MNKLKKSSNTKSAIGWQNGGYGIKGFLYNINDSDSEKNSEMIINELYMNSQSILNIFDKDNIKKIKKVKIYIDECDICIDNFNNYLNEMSKVDNIDFKECKVYKKTVDEQIIKKIDADGAFKKEIIKDLMNICLSDEFINAIKNKSRYYYEEIIKDILESVGFGIDQEKIEMLDDRCIYSLVCIKFDIRAQRKDEKKKNDLIKSINNQKLDVVVKKIDNNYRVVPTSFYTKKNKALGNFLQEYCGLEYSERLKKLDDVKRIIILFVCGEKSYYEYLNNEIKFSMTFNECVKELESDYVSFDDDMSEESIIKSIKKKCSTSYRICLNIINGDFSIYLINRFQKLILKRFDAKDKITKDRIKNINIARYLWNDFFSYISNKYISIGKAVYNFAMPEVAIDNDLKNVEFGQVIQAYTNGITSFDYECIKAKETLEKNLITYITLAKNNFTKALINDEYLKSKNKEDVLFYSANDFKDEKCIKPNGYRNVMMYFGGQSKWADLFDEYDKKYELYYQIARCLKIIRNSVYHYSAKQYFSDSDIKLISKLFFKEYEGLNKKIIALYIEKNANKYFDNDKLCNFIKSIYKKPKQIETRIPKFNTLISRETIDYIINNNLNKNIISELLTKGQYLDYLKSVEFIFKETYTKYFLNINENKDKMIDLIRYWYVEEKEDLRKKQALKDFEKYIVKLLETNKMSFTGLCHYILVNNKQSYYKNNNSKISLSQTKYNNITSDFYYPMFVHDLIKELFIQYLGNEKCVASFYKYPIIETERNDLEFLNLASDIATYEDFTAQLKGKEEVLRWYIVSKFIPDSKVIDLKKDITNYIEYIKDIKNREKITNNYNQKKGNYYEGQYETITRLLEISLLFKENKSLTLDDCFNDEDEYARFLGNFIDFEEEPNYLRLCAIDSHFDYVLNEKNIVNDKIVNLLLYGDDDLIGSCVKKVTSQDIQMYHILKTSINNKKIYGTEKGDNYYKDLKEYDLLKYRVELKFVMKYSYFINDILSKFISYTYQRERDMMYFQLGVAYMKLFFSNAELEKKYHELKNKNICIIDGALLYEIMSMYSFNNSIYKDDDGVAVKVKTNSTASSIMSFCRDYCEELGEYPPTYFCCLELFENIRKHDSYIALRNDIVHGKYHSTHKKSIIDILNDLNGGYFSYDTKKRKGTLNSFKALLNRYDLSIDFKKLFKINEKDEQSIINGNIEYLIPLGKFNRIFEIDKELTKVSLNTNLGYVNEIKKMIEYKCK